MPYSTSNPPYLLSAAPMAMVTNRPKMWGYSSVDAAGVVAGAGYFTNGDALGMKVGDVVLALDNDTSTNMQFHRVTAVTAGGAATVSAGLSIT